MSPKIIYREISLACNAPARAQQPSANSSAHVSERTQVEHGMRNVSSVPECLLRPMSHQTRRAYSYAGSEKSRKTRRSKIELSISQTKRPSENASKCSYVQDARCAAQLCQNARENVKQTGNAQTAENIKGPSVRYNACLARLYARTIIETPFTSCKRARPLKQRAHENGANRVYMSGDGAVYTSPGGCKKWLQAIAVKRDWYRRMTAASADGEQVGRRQ